MEKRKEKHPMQHGYLSGLELSLEIKHAEELLQTSCHWALSLAEGIQDFEQSFMDAVGYLEELGESPTRVGFDKVHERKIRSALLKIRKYSRRMASENKPLSVIDIVEDCQELTVYSNLLKKTGGTAEGRKK
jgi:hypothetical protein